MRVLSETEQRQLDAALATQAEIEKLQQTLREKQATLRASNKEVLRLHDETLGSWVTAAGLGEVDPALLKPGLLALAAVLQNPSAFAQFCEEWLTPEERGAIQETALPPKAEAA